MATRYTPQQIKDQYEKLPEALKQALHGTKVFLTGAKRRNQKAPACRQSFLTRWAVGLHHTRRNGQSGFQSVTQLLDFTHQTHRVGYCIINENNPENYFQDCFQLVSERGTAD